MLLMFNVLWDFSFLDTFSNRFVRFFACLDDCSIIEVYWYSSLFGFSWVFSSVVYPRIPPRRLLNS